MSENLTSNRVLARNSVLNLVGMVVPVVAAILATPPLVRGLGTERFGVLTIAWMVIGYFSLFDLGIGRALTQLVADRLGARREREIPTLVWTSLLVVLVFGSVGGLVVAVASPWIVGSGLNIAPEMQGETLSAMRLLAFSLPWVISTAALRGVLEALQRFDLINAVRIPTGVFNYVGPLVVLLFAAGLVPVVTALVIGRVVGWGIHLWMCLRALPLLRQEVSVRWSVLPPVFRFGGWMTVTNVVSPIMVHMDRFLIGAVLTMSAVAYYVTPFEMVMKLLLVPIALLGVLFPAFASTYRTDRARTAALFGWGTQVNLAVLFPVALVLVLFAHEGLDLWLGADFAREGAPVLRWLAIGILINGAAQAPFFVIQGVGRPDFTGKLHLVELPLYVGALWWLVGSWGIVGAAIAWVLRVSVDTVALLGAVARILPEARGEVRRAAVSISAGVAVLGAATLVDGTVAKATVLAVVIAGFVAVSWTRVLGPVVRGGLAVIREGRGQGTGPPLGPVAEAKGRGAV